MTNTHLLIKTAFAVLLFMLGFGAAAQKPATGDSLYREILHMDSVLFNAFNSQNAEVLSNVFSKDLEFYHDKGGLTNYDQNMTAFKTNFQSGRKVRRELTAGSTEVYPVQGYGAIQTGSHRFCHKENGKDDCGTFKFVHIWKQTPEGWKLARVISFDH